jgi:hypothetical protein
MTNDSSVFLEIAIPNMNHSSSSQIEIISNPGGCFDVQLFNMASPAILIYCFIIAIIWLVVAFTGLFFYFRAIFKKLRGLEIYGSGDNNGLEGNRESTKRESVYKQTFPRMLFLGSNSEHVSEKPSQKRNETHINDHQLGSDN